MSKRNSFAESHASGIQPIYLYEKEEKRNELGYNGGIKGFNERRRKNSEDQFSGLSGSFSLTDRNQGVKNPHFAHELNTIKESFRNQSHMQNPEYIHSRNPTRYQSMSNFHSLEEIAGTQSAELEIARMEIDRQEKELNSKEEAISSISKELVTAKQELAKSEVFKMKFFLLAAQLEATQNSQKNEIEISIQN